jgi:NTP pyrophosphatase (non-canonical NTP hydrolase)
MPHQQENEWANFMATQMGAFQQSKQLDSELKKSKPAEVTPQSIAEDLNALKTRKDIPYEVLKIDVSETFNGYQDFVKSMKVYPEKHAIVYPALGIAGEGGEVAEKVKKWLRGDRELDKLELLKEAGDVLWYLASLADDLGFTFQDMVDENVKKLNSRKARGVQKGDGDNR